MIERDDAIAQADDMQALLDDRERLGEVHGGEVTFETPGQAGHSSTTISVPAEVVRDLLDGTQAHGKTG
jgi:hypothetical protein